MNSGMPVAQRLDTTMRTSKALLSGAVHRNGSLTPKGLSERAFTLAFSSLVYPQIWEDPVVDMQALALEPGHEMVTIASGGCNWASYLTAAPLRLTAVDLNVRHVALSRLKLAALRHLTSYDDLYSLFGNGATARNVQIFDRMLSQYLDPQTRAYWDGRDWYGRRRITLFARGLHRHSLLGRYIAAGHTLARLLGGNPRAIIEAGSLEEQRAAFDRELRPLLRTGVVKHLLRRRSALFGLGIPPAQYDALSGGREMHAVIEERLERLACGFDLKDNYFAWQAFHRGYAVGGTGPLPPYLQRDKRECARRNADNVQIVNASFTAHLAARPASSIDRYSLLDAPDWMSSEELDALWRQITRTARSGARVIFRTAGVSTNLPGRVGNDVMGQWHYDEATSAELTTRDRSAIYGGFHLYVKEA